MIGIFPGKVFEFHASPPLLLRQPSNPISFTATQAASSPDPGAMEEQPSWGLAQMTHWQQSVKIFLGAVNKSSFQRGTRIMLTGLHPMSGLTYMTPA